MRRTILLLTLVAAILFACSAVALAQQTDSTKGDKTAKKEQTDSAKGDKTAKEEAQAQASYTYYGAYPSPGEYYSSCGCFVTPAHSSSVYSYGLSVPPYPGLYAGLDYYYYDQGTWRKIGTQQAMHYNSRQGYSFFYTEVNLPHAGLWAVVAYDRYGGNNGSVAPNYQYWYVY